MAVLSTSEGVPFPISDHFPELKNAIQMIRSLIEALNVAPASTTSTNVTQSVLLNTTQLSTLHVADGIVQKHEDVVRDYPEMSQPLKQLTSDLRFCIQFLFARLDPEARKAALEAVKVEFDQQRVAIVQAFECMKAYSSVEDNNVVAGQIASELARIVSAFLPNVSDTLVRYLEGELDKIYLEAQITILQTSITDTELLIAEQDEPSKRSLMYAYQGFLESLMQSLALLRKFRLILDNPAESVQPA